jgi:phage shock protein PspC (stress-responsive transcriptional regulator)
MKITVSINLGGYSFNIDEDAYAELKRYLKNLEFHFAGDESASEILSDIEARMAELFRTKLTSYKQVINIQDVQQVVAVLGTPEDISDTEGRTTREKFSSPGYHRMYRDPDHRVIGGVCSGVAAYWKLELWLVRLIFLILAFMGVGILIYLILYIVLPEAKTTTEKIEMQGNQVNIHNITESVKKEFNTVRKNMNI